MSGDYSRQRFDARKAFAGVLMQQGRVQLDADWNDLVEMLDRRWRAETTDIVGRGVVPMETPHGFEIGVANGAPTIGPGRMYVDGLLAENFGAGAQEWDPVLADTRGQDALGHTAQPFAPVGNDLPALPAAGTHVVYVDVWQREVTATEDPALLEPAVGVDTTARLQTAWQVRVLPNVDVTCDTVRQHQDWIALTRPSAGRLSTAAVGTPQPEDPCTIPAGAGYRGLENQLYRVEIHEGGPAASATFKFSRDNASVVTAVTEIPSRTLLRVHRTQWDPIRRFSKGDWVEILDDRIELSGRARVLRRIHDVDDARHEITLETDLPGDEFPAATVAARHTRVCRWDQHGVIRDPAGNAIVDLADAANHGVIPVRVGTPIVLEQGVQVTFDVDATIAGGGFRTGDYWTFAARTTAPWVEPLVTAPPRGVHHHYSPLAVVTDGSAADCRVFWPPAVQGTGCDCSVCVTPESHNSGARTIQWAIDQVKDGGGSVCLHAGLYRVHDTPIRIQRGHSVRLKGQGFQTVLMASGAGPALRIDESDDVTIENLAIMTAHAVGAAPVVAVRHSIGVTVQRCAIAHFLADPRAAIGLEGFLLGLVVRDNVLVAPAGITNVAGSKTAGSSYLFTAAMRIDDNLIVCRDDAIELAGAVLHYADTTIARNVIRAGGAGIVSLGAGVAGGRLDVDGNDLAVGGNGIVVGTSRSRIRGNDVTGVKRAGAEKKARPDGIVLTTGFDPAGIGHCQVAANRVADVAGDGISLRKRILSAVIRRNTVDRTGRGGIVMERNGRADLLTVEGNAVHEVGLDTDLPSVAGIILLRATEARVAGNVIRWVGRRRRPVTPAKAGATDDWAGLSLVACRSVHVSGNRIVDVGPVGQYVGEAAGIDVPASFDTLDVTDNTVQRSGAATLASNSGAESWYALRVGRPAEKKVKAGIYASKTGEFGLFGNAAVKIVHAREMLAIRGNFFDAYGDAPAIDVIGRGPVTFGDNRAITTSRKQAAAVIRAAAIIASGNYVRSEADDAALVLVPASADQATVLGNLTTRGIRLGTGWLPNPWAPLNRRIG